MNTVKPKSRPYPENLPWNLKDRKVKLVCINDEEYVVRIAWSSRLGLEYIMSFPTKSKSKASAIVKQVKSDGQIIVNGSKSRWRKYNGDSFNAVQFLKDLYTI